MSTKQHRPPGGHPEGENNSREQDEVNASGLASQSTLLPQHRKLIENSAIRPEVAAARGYRSIADKAELEALGFKPNQCNVPGILIPIHDVDGRVAAHQYRPDSARKNSKGKPVKYETPAGSRLRLDVPPLVREHLDDPRVSLWITEGARKADAAASAGLCCVALMGVSGWRGSNTKGGTTALAEWNLIELNDREVNIAFDSDATQKPQVQKAELALANFLESRGARVRIRRIPGGVDGNKVGLDDYLAGGDTPAQLLAIPPAESGHGAHDPNTAHGKGQGPLQAQILLELASEVELFHDPSGEPWATFRVGNHRETWQIASRAFRLWLMERFFKTHSRPPAAQALQDAIDVLQAQARFDGVERSVHLRIAHGDSSAVVLDLGDDEWRAVRITDKGWEVVSEPPVKFSRPPGARPLPVPVRGGSLAELRQFLNAPDDETWRLLLAWLIGAFNPFGPYPLLVLQGEQGSAKSTTARVLRALVDPAVAPIRTLPASERDLLVSARNSRVLAFDNLSRPPAWVCDALCRLATGGGLSTRELYTNAGEIVLDAVRPVIINGIEDLLARNDMADRAVVATLPRIPDGAYRLESAFWREFEAAKPRILGALMDAVVAAVKGLPHVNAIGLPRMADFAAWVVAAEAALPWEIGAFLSSYCENRDRAVETAIESDAVAQAVLRLVEQRRSWIGTASELLEQLEDLTSKRALESRSWPRSPRSLSGLLDRAAPFLRAKGVSVERGRKGGSGTRLIELKANLDSCVTTATCVTSRIQSNDPVSLSNVTHNTVGVTQEAPGDVNLGGGEVTSSRTAPFASPASASTDGSDGSDAKSSGNSTEVEEWLI